MPTDFSWTSNRSIGKQTSCGNSRRTCRRRSANVTRSPRVMRGSKSGSMRISAPGKFLHLQALLAQLLLKKAPFDCGSCRHERGHTRPN